MNPELESILKQSRVLVPDYSHLFEQSYAQLDKVEYVSDIFYDANQEKRGKRLGLVHKRNPEEKTFFQYHPLLDEKLVGEDYQNINELCSISKEMYETIWPLIEHSVFAERVQSLEAHPDITQLGVPDIFDTNFYGILRITKYKEKKVGEIIGKKHIDRSSLSFVLDVSDPGLYVENNKVTELPLPSISLHGGFERGNLVIGVDAPAEHYVVQEKERPRYSTVMFVFQGSI